MKPKSFHTKVEELTYLIQRFEEHLEGARRSHQNRINEAIADRDPETPKGTGVFSFRRRQSADNTGWPNFMKGTGKAKFIEMTDMDDLIEDLRRISELVVIGENFVTSHQKKQEEELVKSKSRWKDNRDDLAMLGEMEEEEEEDPEMMDHLELFDLFFERNALDTIVGMLSGDSFNVEYPDDKEIFQGALLPPIPVATQALQSISIMIQNVSRATSLYVILSNNTINKLIRLPLDLYSDAIRSNNTHQQNTFASPELSELTTHFVTLLKSLAMRMNAETLQFFLKYPALDEDLGSPYFRRTRTQSEESEEEGPTLPQEPMAPVKLEIQFPLYERALDFCAAHNENFVRTTAMNICLNTLRLTTIVPDENASAEEATGSSPDGVLHNAKALPFKERLAIAQHTCAPSRVERLIAPIFTKLAEKWNSIEEHFREIEAYCDEASGIASSARLDKVQKAKEKVRRDRLDRAFKDKAANLQDELFLLEDVFKVGLTVLSEQTIEMMLATFVYPLLLQPLLLFHQRYESNLDTSREAFSDHPFRGFGAKYDDLRQTLQPVLAPAETSLFTLASVFHCLTNRPLLRLLYTALVHPLSPDSTSVPTVRTTLEVATIDRRGQKAIRLDASDTGDGKVADDRSSYAFGTTPGNRRLSRARGPSLEALEGTEACVFVLSPALAEVLEYRGEDIALVTRTRPNPYRQAILTCLNVPYEMAEVTKICTGMLNASLVVLDSRFASEIAFGSDLKRFGDDMPMDERKLDSQEAHIVDDRDIGSGPKLESRHAISKQKGGSIGKDLTGDIVNALCSTVFYASKGIQGSYQLEFDSFAGHTLLSLIQKNSRGLLVASKTVENRWRQAATFMSGRPYAIHSPLGGSKSVAMPATISLSSEDENDEMYGNVANLLFYEAPDDPEYTPIVENLMRLKLLGSEVDEFASGASVQIAEKANFDSYCSQVIDACLMHANDSSKMEQELVLGRTSAHAVVRANALLLLLKDLGSTGGIGMYDVDIAGAALSKDGSFYNLKECFQPDLQKALFTPLAGDLVSTIFGDRAVPENVKLPELGDIINLVGCPALPCVCEAPAEFAYLFEDDDGVVAEGITWQSLFLVIYHGYLVLAQPNPEGISGEGRVVSIAPLERIQVEHDKEPPETPARRLYFSYRWFDMNPPALFLYDELPKLEEYGPFIKIKSFVSRSEIWFESQRSADAAYQLLSMHIFKCKAERGNRLQKFLFPATPYKVK